MDVADVRTRYTGISFLPVVRFLVDRLPSYVATRLFVSLLHASKMVPNVRNRRDDATRDWKNNQFGHESHQKPLSFFTSHSKSSSSNIGINFKK